MSYKKQQKQQQQPLIQPLTKGFSFNCLSGKENLYLLPQIR